MGNLEQACLVVVLGLYDLPRTIRVRRIKIVKIGHHLYSGNGIQIVSLSGHVQCPRAWCRTRNLNARIVKPRGVSNQHFDTVLITKRKSPHSNSHVAALIFWFFGLSGLTFELFYGTTRWRWRLIIWKEDRTTFDLMLLSRVENWRDDQTRKQNRADSHNSGLNSTPYPLDEASPA